MVAEERDLDGGETLEVNLRADLLQAAEHVGVVAERQPRMQAVDDVDFGERLVGALTQLVEDLLERERVGLRIVGLQARKRAEQAARFADVGRFEPQVVVVERRRAMPLLALAVGEPAQRMQVRRVEEPDAVVQ